MKIFIKKYVAGCLSGMIAVSEHECSKEQILLGTHEFDFVMPDEKVLAVKEIELIQENIEIMSDAFYKQKHIMEGRIQSLLAIENSAVQS